MAFSQFRDIFSTVIPHSCLSCRVKARNYICLPNSLLGVLSTEDRNAYALVQAIDAANGSTSIERILLVLPLLAAREKGVETTSFEILDRRHRNAIHIVGDGYLTWII